MNYKKLAMALVAITLIGLIATTVRAEEQTQCPEGEVLRGGCVEITNYPNGDTITEEVAEKNAEPTPEKDNKAKRSDINKDGIVDIVDLSILLSDWGKVTK